MNEIYNLMYVVINNICLQVSLNTNIYFVLLYLFIYLIFNNYLILIFSSLLPLNDKIILKHYIFVLVDNINDALIKFLKYI